MPKYEVIAKKNPQDALDLLPEGARIVSACYRPPCVEHPFTAFVVTYEIPQAEGRTERQMEKWERRAMARWNSGEPLRDVEEYKGERFVRGKETDAFPAHVYIGTNSDLCKGDYWYWKEGTEAGAPANGAFLPCTVFGKYSPRE